MTGESERLADVAAAVLADPSFRVPAERCRTLASLDEWPADQPPHTEYAATDGACAPIPVGGR